MLQHLAGFVTSTHTLTFRSLARLSGTAYRRPELLNVFRLLQFSLADAGL